MVFGAVARSAVNNATRTGGKFRIVGLECSEGIVPVLEFHFIKSNNDEVGIRCTENSLSGNNHPRDVGI